MTYFTPSTLSDALVALQSNEFQVVAGGTDFYPNRKPGETHSQLLDVTKIPELKGIQQTASGWRIGAATKWTEIVKAELPSAFYGLQLAGQEVGSIQIQNQATIAGNLCNASPAADGVPPLLTLNATVELASHNGTRELPIGEFITGSRQTKLQPNELVVAILIPNLDSSMFSSYIKLGSRKYLVISIAMVSVLVSLDEEKIKETRVSVGSCSEVATRLTELELALTGQPITAMKNSPRFAAMIEQALAPISDHRASAAYREHTVPELVFRTLNHAVNGA